MANPAGGLRDRLIEEAFFRLIDDSLDELGWKTAASLGTPVTVRAEPVEDDDVPPLNTVAVFADVVSGFAAELGSNLTEDRRVFWVDVYAESDQIGRHISGDIRDILRGLIPAIGRNRPHIEVLDYTLATPTSLFFVDIEDVVDDRAHGPRQPHERHWFSVRCDVVDTTLGGDV